VRVAGGSDFAHGSAGDAGRELAGIPGDASGESDDSADDSHGDDGSGFGLAALSEETTERTDSRAHYGWSPGGTDRTPENLTDGLAVEH
jgi:hypothetical protein